MMWLIHGWLKRAVLWAVGAALAVFGIWTAGKRHARQKAKIEGLEADNKSLTDRERIEDEVATDPDLVSRARRSVLRKPVK